jgi:NADH:ubiquinone oxidoreductase subunit 2 (subunit N)
LWGIGTSAISVFYYLRVALLMYSSPDDTRRYPWSRTSLSGAVALIATAAGTLGFGVFAYALYNIASVAPAAIQPVQQAVSVLGGGH